MKLHPDQMGHTHVVRNHIPAGAHLRDRHVHIWRQLVIGGSNREIARRTNLAEKTVKNYLTDLYDILGLNRPGHNYIRSRTLATLWGIEILHAHPEVFRDAERRR